MTKIMDMLLRGYELDYYNLKLFLIKNKPRVRTESNSCQVLRMK